MAQLTPPPPPQSSFMKLQSSFMKLQSPVNKISRPFRVGIACTVTLDFLATMVSSLTIGIIISFGSDSSLNTSVADVEIFSPRMRIKCFTIVSVPEESCSDSIFFYYVDFLRFIDMHAVGPKWEGDERWLDMEFPLIQNVQPLDSDAKCGASIEKLRLLDYNAGRSRFIGIAHQSTRPTYCATVKVLRLRESTTFVLDREKKRIMPLQVPSISAHKIVILKDIKVAVCLYAFDIHYLSGQTLLLEQLDVPKQLLYWSYKEEEAGFFQFPTGRTSNDLQVASVDTSIERLVIITYATYDPPTEKNWLKLKKDYIDGFGDSLDLVPIAAFHGAGKHTGVYGSFRLAFYNNDNQQFQSMSNTDEITMFDNYIVIYKFIQDFYLFVTGGEDENKLILPTVLQGLLQRSQTSSELNGRSLDSNENIVFIVHDGN